MPGDTLPSWQDLGALPSAGGAMPIGRPDPSPIARGAEALAQGAANLGKGISAIGEAVGQVGIDQQRYEYATAHSDFLAKKIDLDASVAHDQDFATLPQRYGDQLTQLQNDSARAISNPAMRNRFMQETGVQVAQGNAKIAQHAFGLQGNAAIADTQQSGVDLINRAVTLPPDSPDRAAAIAAHDARLAALRAQGFITPEQELAERQRWAHQYALADGIERAKTDPQGVINDLRAAPGSPAQITNRILQVEGTSANPRSSAVGAGQFTNATWLDVLKRNRPDLAQGRSDAELLALRADQNLARDMTEAYRGENEASLKAQGLPATPGQQYLAHFLGPGGAAAVLKANPRMPVDQALAAAVGPDKARQMVDANPTVLRGQLAGTVAQWADTKMGGVGPGGGHLYDILRPDQRAVLLAHAEGQLDKQKTGDVAAFHNSVQDDLAEADRTGMVTKPKALPDFVQHFGAERGPQLYADYQAQLRLGADKQRLSNMSPPQVDELLQSYEPTPGQAGYAGAVKRLDALTAAAHEEGQKRLKASLDSDLAEVSRTGTVTKPKTRADFDLAYGEDKGGDAYGAYQEVLAGAREARMLPSATPQTTQAMIAAHAPVPGPDYAANVERQDALIKVAQALAKEREDDPAQYGLNYLPGVRESWQALTDTLNDATASPDVRAAMARDYATKQTMEQQRLGVPAEAIRIAPKAYTDHLLTQLSAAANGDDPNKRVAVMAQLQREAQMWGSYWPQVMGQLGDKMTPLVRAVAADVDAQGRPLHQDVMTRLLSLKPTDTASSILSEAEGGTKVKDIRENLATAFHDFRGSLMPRQLDRDYPGYVAIAEKLAAMHVLAGEGAPAAATKAFNELIGDRYEFRDNWRMPKNAKVDADDVQAGTVAARAAIADMAGGAPTDNLEAAKRDLNLTPQEEALYRRHLTNLVGPGGVDNQDGSRSTLYQMSFERDGRTYNVPTVWDGKILKPDEAMRRATAEGIDKFPSYGSGEEAEARYAKMHDYMERDTGRFLQQRHGLGAIVPFRDDMGVEDNRADSLSKFARDGRFVTSPNNDGLNLYMTSERRGASLPVRTRDGQPLLLRWADLAALAKSAPRNDYTPGFVP